MTVTRAKRRFLTSYINIKIAKYDDWIYNILCLIVFKDI